MRSRRRCSIPTAERLKRDAGIDYVVLNASHCHNTPETNPETAEHTATKRCGCRGER